LGEEKDREKDTSISEGKRGWEKEVGREGGLGKEEEIILPSTCGEKPPF